MVGILRSVGTGSNVTICSRDMTKEPKWMKKDGTPEEIAIKQAERCRGKVVIDCFSGIGGNTIQFVKV